MSKQPNFASIQLALFFRDALTGPEDIWADLKATDFVKTFDETPLIMPLPDDAELDEAPAVTLTSKNSPHRAMIARRRADIVWIASEKDERKFEEMKEGFYALMQTFFEKVSNRMQVIRMGYVLKFFFDADTPEKHIANLLSTAAKSVHGDGTLFEASAKIVTRNLIEGIEINNNSSLVKAEKKTKDGKAAGIMLTRDFNTIPERKEALSWEQIFKICKAVESKLQVDQFQQLLWPAEK